MSSLSDPYRHLIALTQLYISQEYGQGERIVCDPTSFAFLKDYAIQLRARGNQAPTPIPAPVFAPQAPKAVPVVDKIATKQPPTPTKAPPPVQTPAQQKAPPVVAKTPLPIEPSGVPSFFVPQPMGKGAPLQLDEWRKLMTTHFPAIPLTTDIPPDTTAKAQKNPDPSALRVLILSTESTPEKQQFLQKLTQALQERLPSAKLVSHADIQKEGWDQWLHQPSLRMVIGTSRLLELSPELKKEGWLHQDGSRLYLKTLPLLLLEEIDLYLQNADAKRTLWNTLRAELKL